MHYPKIMQPTHVKWEELSKSDYSILHVSNGVSELTNGVHQVNLNGTHIEANQPSTTFSSVSPVVSRNFLVVDTKFESPPIPGLGIPGPDGDVLDVGPNGLPNVTDEILAEMPQDCRKALLEAKAEEQQWKQKWGTEVEHGARGQLKIGFLGYPV
jgi:chromatin structure-remodeling complex protein RSC7